MPIVQTQIAKKATNYLQEEFNVDIAIKRVDLSILGKVNFKEVLIKNHHSDTLISAQFLKTTLYSFTKILNNKLEFKRISLDNFTLNIKTYKNEVDNALTVFVEKFDDSTASHEPSNFRLTSNDIKLNRGHVTIVDENIDNNNPLFFKNIKGIGDDFKIIGPNVSVTISDFSFIENHRVEVTRFDTEFTYTKSFMKFLNTTLETETSILLADIEFNYDRDNFSDFNNKVNIEAQIFDSKISLFDLQKFYNEIGDDGFVELKTKLNGQLNDLTFENLNLKSNRNTIINGDLNLKNSFNTENGFELNGDFENLTTNYSQLIALLPNLLGKSLPNNFKKLGMFTLKGQTQVTKELLKANVNIKTDIGETNTDLTLTNIQNFENASYKGKVKIIDFELGQMLGDSLIGQTSLNVFLDGEGFTLEKLNTTVNGDISALEYNNYNYKNIKLNGVAKNKNFNGELEVNDDNIKLNFNGLADLSSEIYKFDFKTIVDYCDLNKLNIFTRDTISNLKGVIEINLVGNKLDNLAGAINFKNSLYVNHKGNYFFEDFSITSTFEDKIRTITINSSEIIEGKLVGNFRIYEFGKLIQNSIGSIYSNYKPFEVTPNQKMDFRLEVYNKIVEVFVPEIVLSANSVISGKIDSDKNLFKLNIRSPKIIAYENILDSLNLQIDNKNPLFNTQLAVDKIHTDLYDISDLHLVNKTLNDTLYFGTQFKGGVDKKQDYNLYFFHTFNENNQSVIGVQKSNFTFKKNKWIINPEDNFENKVVYNNKNKTYTFSPFIITSGQQVIDFEGVIQDTISKNISLNFKNVNLANITPDIDSLNIEGLVNGSFSYNQNLDQLIPEAKLSILDFSINDSRQGDLNINIEGKNSVKQFTLDVLLQLDNNTNFSAVGDLDFTPQQPTLDVQLDFNAFKLDAFSPLGEDVFNNIRGYAYGNIHLTGLLKNPEMEGDLFLDEAGLYFPYLNVDYNFKGTSVISLKNQVFNFEDVTIQDTKYNSIAKLGGSLSHSNFEKWNLGLQIQTKNLVVLDTQEEETSLYYGTAFFEGAAAITGPTDKLVIDVTGKTKKNTHFVVPLSYVKTAKNSQLVRFVNIDDVGEIEKIRQAFISEKLKGMSMNFNLEVTKDALFEMVIDKTSGSNLKGTGTGNLFIALDTKDKFEMYGDYVVDNGVYDFKYGGIINKPFTVRKGGVISWNGDPLTAEINIEAIHRVSANPRVLLENISSNRKMPVDLITRFSGELFDSNIDFDIEIPNSSSTVASELEFKLSNNINTQFISLLVTGTFYNEADAGLNSSAMFYGTGVDVLSNAFDNILNDPSSKFKLKPVYTVGENNKVDNFDVSDQFALDMDYQVNDRIIINGKVGVPIGAEEKASVIGEVNIEFLMNESGTFRSSVFNRQNDIQYSDEEEGYTQGIGLSYQIDFDNGKELLERLSLRKKVVTDSINNQQETDSILNQKLINFKNKKEIKNE